MKKFKTLCEKPLGQVLLAALLFCVVFGVLIAGLTRAGTAYLFKERSRRSVNLTALTAGAVYANGLQLVRESNILLMAAATFDALTVGQAVGTALLAPPPLDITAIIAAAKFADPKTRKGVQETQRQFFGIGLPSGIYPLLLFSQAVATSQENQLSFPPCFLYNCETATLGNAPIPNMALRFRTAADLLPEPTGPAYSLTHEGIRHFFSPEEVEPAPHSRHNGQMRVKKNGFSDFAGWWVRKEKSYTQNPGSDFLAKFAPRWALQPLRDYLKNFQLDVTDRDDPPCHTFTLLGFLRGNKAVHEISFSQAGEIRVEAEGLAAWDVSKPIQVRQELVDLDTLPLLRDTLKTFKNIPLLDSFFKESDLLNGL